MDKLLNGKKVRKEILTKLKTQVEKLPRKLGLCVIQVGNDPASCVYIRQKEKMAEQLNYNFRHLKFKENISEKELLNKIEELNKDDLIDGILVQMPLPKHLNPRVRENAIDPLKDVDGLTDINTGKLFHNVDSLIPCTPKGIIDLLAYYQIPLEGKNVVIIGRSDLVGKPLEGLMTNRNATVTLCHSKTKNLQAITKTADILVVAVGKPHLITKEYIKDGTIIIDVGINRLEDGTLCGDVLFEDVKEKASAITPVPGGVGPMTIAELAQNTYQAYLLKNKKTL